VDVPEHVDQLYFLAHIDEYEVRASGDVTGTRLVKAFRRRRRVDELACSHAAHDSSQLYARRDACDLATSRPRDLATFRSID